MAILFIYLFIIYFIVHLITNIVKTFKKKQVYNGRSYRTGQSLTDNLWMD